jgi:hypothetical protein
VDGCQAISPIKRYRWILSVYLELYGQDSSEMVAIGEGIILIQEIGGTLTFWTKYPETQCL